VSSRYSSTDHLGWGVKWRFGSVTTLLSLVLVVPLIGFSYSLVVNDNIFFPYIKHDREQEDVYLRNVHDNESTIDLRHMSSRRVHVRAPAFA
jgi:hypothetical protein